MKLLLIGLMCFGGLAFGKKVTEDGIDEGGSTSGSASGGGASSPLQDVVKSISSDMLTFKTSTWDDLKRVRVTIKKKEITQYEWYVIMGNNPSYYRKKQFCPTDYLNLNGIEICKKNPVESVTYDQVKNFIDKLNSISKKNYRLPGQWELYNSASYTGFSENFNFLKNLNKIVEKTIWHSENSNNQMHQVGTKDANHRGLYDILGNVEEMVSIDGKFYFCAGSIRNAKNEFKYLLTIEDSSQLKCRERELFSGQSRPYVGFRLALD
jgi:hypothetical protein